MGLFFSTSLRMVADKTSCCVLSVTMSQVNTKRNDIIISILYTAAMSFRINHFKSLICVRGKNPNTNTIENCLLIQYATKFKDGQILKINRNDQNNRIRISNLRIENTEHGCRILSRSSLSSWPKSNYFRNPCWFVKVIYNFVYYSIDIDYIYYIYIV